jgi:hypothetical protein
MTPFTNGKKRLMDSDASSAEKRERAGSEPSNTARVTDAAVAGRAAGALRGGTWEGGCCSGEWGREGSGNERDGKEDATEDGTFSQCGESDGAGRDVGAPGLVVDRVTFDYDARDHNISEKEQPRVPPQTAQITPKKKRKKKGQKGRERTIVAYL